MRIRDREVVGVDVAVVVDVALRPCPRAERRRAVDAEERGSVDARDDERPDRRSLLRADPQIGDPVAVEVGHRADAIAEVIDAPGRREHHVRVVRQDHLRARAGAEGAEEDVRATGTVQGRADDQVVVAVAVEVVDDRNRGAERVVAARGDEARDHLPGRARDDANLSDCAVVAVIGVARRQEHDRVRQTVAVEVGLVGVDDPFAATDGHGMGGATDGAERCHRDDRADRSDVQERRQARHSLLRSADAGPRIGASASWSPMRGAVASSARNPTEQTAASDSTVTIAHARS